MLEAYRLDREIVVAVNPVGTRDIEIAEISPLVKPAVRVDAILSVELADLAIRRKRLGGPVLIEKMNW